MRWVIFTKRTKGNSTHYSVQAILENVPSDGFREIFIRPRRTRDRLGLAWPKQKGQEPESAPWFWVPPELLERMRRLLQRELVLPKESWGDFVRVPWNYASNYIRLMAEDLDKKGAIRRLDWNDR